MTGNSESFEPSKADMLTTHNLHLLEASLWSTYILGTRACIGEGEGRNLIR